MAYRICYGETERKHSLSGLLRLRIVCAVLLLAMVWGLNAGWPEGRGVLKQVFLPDEEISAAARVLCDGGSIREGLVEACRAVLAEAGYEA